MDGAASPVQPGVASSDYDFDRINDRLQYAFGVIFTARLGKETTLTRGIKMLWPHISRDVAGIPADKLEGMLRTLYVLLDRIINPQPGMSFAEHLNQPVEFADGKCANHCVNTTTGSDGTRYCNACNDACP